MKLDRVVLIQPPVDKRFQGSDMVFKRLAPPTGLAILACETEQRLKRPVRIRAYFPSEITDGMIRVTSEADFLGISSWFSNYENGLEIARRAKEANPYLRVIFGGVNASNLGGRILKNRSCVDLVLAGDGEDSLHWLTMFPKPKQGERPLKQILVANEIDLDSIGPWDFRHFPDARLDPWDFRREGYSFDYDLSPVGISMTRGCKKAATKGRCLYCSVYCRGLRTTDPDNVWRQVCHLQDLYGVESFFETGDDPVMMSYVRQLVKAKPHGLRFRLRIYASPWHLTQECIDLLAELGVYEIFLGLETIDQNISDRAGHPFSTKQTVEALNRLSQAGISVCLPIMLGLPGETRESAQKTIDFVEEQIGRFDNIRMVLCSLAIPLIGSRWFEDLRQDPAVRSRYTGDLDNDDVFDYARLLELSLQRERQITLGDLIEILETSRARLEDKVEVGCFGGLA